MAAKYTYCCVIPFCVFLLFYSFPSHYCYAVYNITPSQPLSKAEILVSPSQIFELGFFTLNNSGNQYVGIWYSKQISPSKVIVWIANRKNALAVTDSAATLTIGSNGNLNLVDGKANSVWKTDIPFPYSNNSVAVLFDNGSLVLKDSMSGQVLWQSSEHPGNALLPKAKLGFNVRTGERYELTSWKTETDPSIGNFTMGLSQQRPSQAFIWNGSNPHWRSGPWNKIKFTGAPEMDPSYLSGFKLEEDVEQGSAAFSMDICSNSSCHMFISSQGVAKVMQKDKETDWYFRWEAPKSSCDAYGVCGPFAVCKASESPICKCMKGFVPKSNEEWKKGNWKGGCVRRTKLICDISTANSLSSLEGKKDGFWKKGMVKLPDFHEYVQIEKAETCNAWCQSNCSCLAYTFVNGIGCLIWSKDLVDIQEFSYGGEDLFLRLAHTELDGGGLSKKVIISLAAIGATGIIVVVMFIAWYRWRANRKGPLLDLKKAGKIKETAEHFNLTEMNDNSIDTLQSARRQDPHELAIFNFESILVATNDFNITNKLGQGGFGPVFKGILHDGKEVAIKRLSSNSGQGIKEFKNELTLISKLQHRNLVTLMGCCIHKEEKLLVYEFMPNKSLDFFLFDQRRRSELNWARRFNIIHGVAKGIVYLHRDSCLRIIHRDLKASNILLDGKMNPKISDFGLARIFQETIDIANTRRVVGTLGYMSPEYAMEGMFSEKSDVYSFGVLLLEIVSGKKSNSFDLCDQQLNLIAYAWQLWSENRALELVDETILADDSYSTSEVVRCIGIGLLCAQDHPMDRPTMPEVVILLSNERDRPKPKRPSFYFGSSLKSCDLQPQNGIEYCSTNEATVSMIEGR